MMTINIEDIKYSLYNKSERFWWFSLGCWVLAVMASIASIFVEQKIILGIIGAISLFIPFCIVWLREIAMDFSFKADKCRRLILYSDGLGASPSVSDLLTVMGYSVGEKKEKAFYEPPYYDSTLSAGPSRLLDIIGESAFFTKELSTKVENTLNIILITMLAILVILGASSKFWVGFVDVTSESLIDFIEAFTIFIVALVAGDVYLLKKKYSMLAIESDKVFNSASKQKNEEEISDHQVLIIASDYDACVQMCPPIPLIIYKRYVAELNAIYKDVSKQWH